MIARLRGGKRKETELHERFSGSRIHGEWFNRTAPVQAWLDEIEASLPDHALAIRDEDDVEEDWPLQKKLIYSAIVFVIVYLLAS